VEEGLPLSSGGTGISGGGFVESFPPELFNEATKTNGLIRVAGTKQRRKWGGRGVKKKWRG